MKKVTRDKLTSGNYVTRKNSDKAPKAQVGVSGLWRKFLPRYIHTVIKNTIYHYSKSYAVSQQELVDEAIDAYEDSLLEGAKNYRIIAQAIKKRIHRKVEIEYRRNDLITNVKVSNKRKSGIDFELFVSSDTKDRAFSAEQIEIILTLKKLATQLPYKERLVFALYWYGFTLEEIADNLNVTPPAAKYRLDKAISQLKEMVK